MTEPNPATTDATETWGRIPDLNPGPSPNPIPRASRRAGTEPVERVAWRAGLAPRFAFSECSVVLVTAPVHGWSSISGQCRQQVNTPCRKRLQSDALMNVWKTFLVPCILTSGVMNMVVGSCGHVVEGQRGGQLVELSTALAGARSASSTCPQLGFCRVGLAGACSPIVPRTFKSVQKHVAHVPCSCPQPERL